MKILLSERNHLEKFKKYLASSLKTSSKRISIKQLKQRGRKILMNKEQFLSRLQAIV